MNDLTPYDELQARVKAAYTYHVETWSMMHPPPEPDSANVSRLDLVVALSLVILVLASVIVSGSRTIVEFGSYIGGLPGVVVGASAFVMLEIALVIYAFFDTKKAGGHSDRYVRRAARFGLVLAFIVSAFANAHATFKGQGIAMSPLLDILIILLVAISAPTLALISGHILGSEVVSILNRKAEVSTRHAESMTEWKTALNRSWDSQKAKLGIRIEVPHPASEVSSDRQMTAGDTLTLSQQKVWDYLESDDSAASLSVRELSAAVGVNRNTTAETMRMWRESKGSQL